jgi:hypothetical protein
VNEPNKKFSLFPIERLAKSWENGGFDDGDFDRTILPFEIIPGLFIEDVESLIPPDEFDHLLQMLGLQTVRFLKAIKYVIINRYPERSFDPDGNLIFGEDLRKGSEYLIQEAIACLRLIRPIRQFAQSCGGDIRDDGSLINFHFENPLSFVDSPENQNLFRVRTNDAENLRFFMPLFQQAMSGNFWKFRMALEMYQSGFFQHSHWKARYFLWTAALESLYTSQPHPGSGSEHSGSLVAKERIKHLLGPTTPIYPQGELTNLDPNPNLTVADVIDEIYCLRNNIAHGDKIPDYYFHSRGRIMFDGNELKKVNMLIEAISSIIRQSLLAILKKGLLNHFQDRASSEAYFGGLGLTKTLLSKRVPKSGFTCP